MKVTAAVANKMVKKLQSELDFMYSQQSKKREFIAIPGQEPIVPEYDYADTQKQICELELTIRKLKHAINMHNVTTTLDGWTELTIDQALVLMGQYNKRLKELSVMRAQQKRVLDTGGMFNSKQQIQYVVANFNPEDAGKDWKVLYEELQVLQTAIDVSNNTVTFEVDV